MPAVKHTVSNLQERKNYNFKCGIKAYQEECDYAQDKQILALLKTLEVKDLNSLTVNDILTKITDDDNLLKFLEIILVTESDVIQGWSHKLKRTEIAEVVDDFFTLSPVLKKWFGTGKFGVASLLGLSPSKKDSV